LSSGEVAVTIKKKKSSSMNLDRYYQSFPQYFRNSCQKTERKIWNIVKVSQCCCWKEDEADRRA
jgi:hypothetical protein